MMKKRGLQVAFFSALFLPACGSDGFQLQFTSEGAIVHQIPHTSRTYRRFPQGMTQPQVTALGLAAQAWNNAKGVEGNPVVIGDSIAGAATFGQLSADGLSRVHLVGSSGAPLLGKPGVTQTWFSLSTGEIFQSNIWLDQAQTTNYPTSPIDDALLTLVEAAAHEMGHGLGAGHMPTSSMAVMKLAANSSNTMGRFGVEGNAYIGLHADDVGFGNFLYGSALQYTPWVIRTLPYKLNNGIVLSHGQTGAPQQLTRCRGSAFQPVTTVQWLSDSDVTSPLSSLSVRLSSDTTISSMDTSTGSVTLPSTQGQFTLFLTINTTVPANMAFGTYWVGVRVENGENVGTRLNLKIVVNC